MFSLSAFLPVGPATAPAKPSALQQQIFCRQKVKICLNVRIQNVFKSCVFTKKEAQLDIDSLLHAGIRTICSWCNCARRFEHCYKTQCYAMNQVTQPISCWWLLPSYSTPCICATFHLVLILPPGRTRHQGVVRPFLGDRGGQGRGVGREEHGALAHLRATLLKLSSLLEIFLCAMLSLVLSPNTLKKQRFGFFVTIFQVTVRQPRASKFLSRSYLGYPQYIGILAYWPYLNNFF